MPKRKRDGGMGKRPFACPCRRPRCLARHGQAIVANGRDDRLPMPPVGCKRKRGHDGEWEFFMAALGKPLSLGHATREWLGIATLT